MLWFHYGILWCILVSTISATVISNLNVIFETFGPLSMVRFFEFNDVGWNITEKCIKDMFLYLDGLHKDVLWAVKLYDASGYYSGSIYAGNNIRKGNPQLCRNLNNEMASNDYRMFNKPKTLYDDLEDFMTISNLLPFPVQLVNVKYKTFVDSAPFQSSIIHQTVCLPKSCTHNDLMQVMTYANLTHLRNNLIMRNTELIQIKILNESYQVSEDGAFYLFVCLTSFFIFLGLLGTIFESFTNFDVKVNLMKIERKNSIAMRRHTHENDNYSLYNSKDHRRNKRHTETAKNRVNYLKVFKMEPFTETADDSDRIKSTKNVNLVQVKEIKSENVSTISVDIISTKYADSTNTPQLHVNHPAQSELRKILLAFSWRRNYEILFSDLQQHCISDVIEISGLKFLFLLWVLLVHVCTVLYYVADNKMYKNQMNSLNILQGILDSGSLSIDTHFFLCGVCVAHMFLNRLKNVDVEFICSCFDNLLHISTMIVYKVLGLTLPYIATLLLLQMCMKYFYDYGIIDIPSLDHQTCQINMWRNLFYIDQFYPLDDRCMIWSWILSLETQFFIVASIILLILKNHPRYGIAIFCSFLISSFVATTTLRFHDHHQHQKLNSSLMFDEQLAFYNSLYDQPWARLSPYFFGICMGYILHKTEEKLEINIIVVTCGWIACFFLLIGLIFSKTFIPLSSHWMDTILSTINHTIWSMILVWMIVASISTYRGFIGRLLGAQIFIPFSKMTNCFLLIHPLITRIVLLNYDGSIHLSIGLILTMYIGFAMTTFFCSFLLYMIYEAPMEELLRIVYNRKQNLK